MTTLALLAADYRAAAAMLADLELDEQTVADTLESLSGALEIKAQNLAMFVRSLEADAAAVRQWAKDANERAKALDARADSLRDYLARELAASGIQKVDGPGVFIGWRKSQAVEIDEPALIPAQYMRQKPPPPAEPDKAAIMAAIKLGEVVPGAHVETRNNLQIK